MLSAYARTDDTPSEDHKVVFRERTWADFLQMLEWRGDVSSPRFTFLDGTLEIMSPSFNHEAIKSLIGSLIEYWALERGVVLTSAGSWTLKEESRSTGIEPDECYVVGERREQLPDLAVEVVWTSGGVEKLDAYRRLGVREVWVWRRGRIGVHALNDNGYVPRIGSEVLPGIDVDKIAELVDSPSTTHALRAWRDWLSAAPSDA